MSETQSLTKLKVGGYKRLSIAITSVEYKLKKLKLPLNFHFITFCHWLRITSNSGGGGMGDHG